ncbi:MAG TPA: sugar ABC transporter substrate-binding protein [Spirochaetia bacterium]|nr:sugar ABC transporter substrate-binding protein [Spirochaetia bacterium]
MKGRSAFLSVLLFAVSGFSYVQAQTIRYFSWEPNIAEQTKVLISQFEQAHPGVKIQYEDDPPAQYWPKMSALAAAHRLPDVFYMSSGFIDQWHSEGLLADLSSYASNMDWSKYFTGALPTARFPHSTTGDLFALPIDWVGTVLYYNKDAFDKAGLSYPTNNWRWSDFSNAAKQLTVRDGNGKVSQWGFWVYGRYAQIEPWIYQNDGRILNANRTRVSLDSNATSALRFLTDLVNVDHVAPPPKLMSGINQQDVFPRGLAAMWVDGSWNIANNRKIAGNMRWGIAMVPQGPDATSPEAYTWPDMMAMSSSSRNKQIAWEFLKYMTGPARPANTYLAGTVPFAKSTEQTVLQEDQGRQPSNESMLLELGKLPGTTSFTPGWSEWRGYAASGSGGMNGELDQVFNGEESLSTAIQKFTSYANQVLGRTYPNP